MNAPAVKLALTAAARVALVTAALGALLRLRADGYFAAGLGEVAWTTLTRDLGSLFAMTFAGRLVFGVLLRGLPGPIAVFLADMAAVFLVSTGLWIAPTRATPSLDSAGGRVVLFAIAAVAAAAAAVNVLATRHPEGRAARWTGGGRVAALSVFCLAGGASAEAWVRTRSSHRTPVVLISLDTLRADRLTCYGHDRETTPFLDELARAGVRFDRAISPYPWTLVSHASMLTGVYPSVHGAEREQPVHENLTTIAHAFRDAGYLTAALVDGCKWLNPEYGYADGFSIYRQIWGSIEDKNRELEELLADCGDRPLFLFLHYFDVHSDADIPYDSPPPFRGRYSSWYTPDFFAPRGERASPQAEWQKNGEPVDLDAEELRFISDLYDEGVAYTDAQLRNTVDILRRNLPLDQACLLVTADHGEEFCEHGRFRHWQFYEECVRIPLILRLPGSEHAGTVIHDAVTLVDVVPTLAEVAAVDTAAPCQGTSLLRFLEPERPDPRPIFLDGGIEAPMSVVEWPWKLIRKADHEELYHLDEDPGERDDRAAREPEKVAHLLARLQAQERENDRLQTGLGRRAGRGVKISDEERLQLEAIGYVEEQDSAGK